MPSFSITSDSTITHIRQEMPELSGRAREEGREYEKKRFAYAPLERHARERAFVALVGPRGVGKSILLKQLHFASDDSFYVSLDATRPSSLFGIAKELSDRKFGLLLLDEIHAYPDYGKELKKIYDFLPKLHVVFTSSSAVSLYDTSYDLSRRVRIVDVPPFSFREFLSFRQSREVPGIAWADLLDLEKSKAYYGKTMEFEPLFAEYLQGKNYPFTLDQPAASPLFLGMLNAVIEKDLVATSKISLEDSFKVRDMLQFIGRSPVEGISYSSISANTGVSKGTAKKFVGLLENAYLLRRVAPKGTNVNKEPKILLSLPYRLLYKQYEDCIGALREDFFVDAVSRLGLELDYLKGTRGEKTPDYLVGGLVCEIGGRNKGRSQFKGFAAKRKIIFTQPGTLDDIRRPLFFAGMLG